MMSIRKGDMVVVIAGKEKGKTGKVLELDRKKQRVLVERLNMVKRHQRPTQVQKQGGVIEKEAAIHISNVMLYDEKAGKGSRVGWKVLTDGKKVRISRRSGEVVDATK
jgi:large subunit ribosomal protein L24